MMWWPTVRCSTAHSAWLETGESVVQAGSPAAKQTPLGLTVLPTVAGDIVGASAVPPASRFAGPIFSIVSRFAVLRRVQLKLARILSEKN